MPALPKRKLGRTGLDVTMLGYGAMEIRGAPRGRDVTDQQAETILHAVLDAGISYIGRLATAPIQQVERALEVNLMGVWRTDRALIEQITARRGYLLNIASLSAASHTPLMGPYSASKRCVMTLNCCTASSGNICSSPPTVSSLLSPPSTM